MIIQNARLYGKEGLWKIITTDGTITAIHAQVDFEEAPDTLDVKGKLILPPFVEPHMHLDYVLTAGQPRWNQTGTLFEGIECWSERKLAIKETKEDIKKRALQGLRMQIEHGIQHVRTHVDITDPTLLAFEAMLEIKEEIKPWVDLQIVAFPQEGIYAYPKGGELLEEAIKMGADAVGGIPHFEFTREDGVASMKLALDLAYRYDRLVDIHCDETDDDQSRFLEVVAAEAYRLGIGERVTASHTTAMHSYNNAYAYKLFRLLKLSNIHFVACPLANVHLQGRFDSYPKRRGVTRVKELLEAGMNVTFGHDSIVDPWYPLGNGNMMRVLEMGIHACHMMGYDDIVNSLDLITTNGAKALNISEEYGVEVGKPANLIVLDADSPYEAVRCQAPLLYSIRNGEIIVETQPAQTTIRNASALL